MSAPSPPGRRGPSRSRKACTTTSGAALPFDSVYRHQAEAWEAAQRGEHFVVTTGTASGKTLAFNLPVADALAREPKQRAFYLYPTKALAQDQARALSALGVKRLRPAIYDGDTETERRWQIRKWANVILTNPDMLHVGILPHHDRWGDVFQNLRYVIVDEAHVYRGVFGSHVANVLRRLRRVAAIYGAEPQFLLASATIANPGELAHSLLGVDATVDRGRRRAARRADGRVLEPAARGRGARAAREPPRRGLAADGRPRLARPAHDLLRQVAARGGAHPPLHRRAARRRARRRAGSLPIARATPRSSDARSSGGSSRGSCSA